MSGPLTPSQVQQRLIRVVVQTPDASKRELKEIAKQLGEVNQSVSALASVSKLLQGVWAFNLFGVAVSDLARMADTMSLLNARATIFSKSGTDVSTVVSGLVNVARDLRAPLDGIAESFSRIEIATEKMNVSGNAQLKLTELLGASFKLSGATSEEAATSVQQLALAFEEGSINGRGLSVILRQNAVLAKGMIEAARAAGGNVRTLAAEGFFSNQKMFTILKDLAPQILSQFEKLPPTFADLFNRMRTEVTVTAGTINSTFGISSGLYKGFDYMATVVPRLTDDFAALAVSVGLVGSAFATWSIIGTVSKFFDVILFALAPFVANLGVLGTIASVVGGAIEGLVAILFSWVGVAVAAVGGLFFLIDGFIKAYGGVKNLDLIVTALKLNFNNLVNFSIIGLIEAFKVLGLALRATLIFFTAGISEITPLGKMFDDATEKLNAYSRSLDKNINLNNKFKDALKVEAGRRSPVTPELTDTEKQLQKIKDFQKAMEELANGKNSGKIKTIAQQIGELNAEFNRTGNFDKYESKIEKLEIAELNEKLKKGTITLKKWHQEFDVITLGDWQRKLDAGRASLEQFGVASRTFQIKELKDKFDTAKISANEFYSKVGEISGKGPIDILDKNVLIILKNMNIELGIFTAGWQNAGAKISYGLGVGLRAYNDNIKGLAEQVASATTGIANNLESTLVDAFANGKDSFANFSQFIIQELTRIVVRLTIMKPLLESIANLTQSNGLGGLFGSVASAYAGSASSSGGGLGIDLGTPTLSAGSYAGKVGALSNNYNTSNYSNTANSQSTGDINLTVINNNNSGVSVSQSTAADGSRNIEMIIDAKVNTGLATGKYDNQLRNNFNINRKGT